MPAGPNTELKLPPRLSSISSFDQQKDRIPGVQVCIQDSVEVLKKIIYSMFPEVKAHIMKYASSLLTYVIVLKHLIDLNRCEFEPILSHADT